MLFCFHFISFSVNLHTNQISEGKESVYRSFRVHENDRSILCRPQTYFDTVKLVENDDTGCLKCLKIVHKSKVWSALWTFDTVKPNMWCSFLFFICEDLCIARKHKTWPIYPKNLNLGSIEINNFLWPNICLCDFILYHSL